MKIKRKEKVNLWMPLYITDYLGDTMHLSTEQHGAYFLLLMAAWKNDGHLNDDDQALRMITRMSEKSWEKSRSTVRKFFVESPDGLRHKRIDEEIATFKQLKDQRSKAGKASALKRNEQQKLNENSTGVATKPLRKSNPSPSPNLPSVVIENLPSQGSDDLGQIDPETGEVLSWAA